MRGRKGNLKTSLQRRSPSRRRCVATRRRCRSAEKNQTDCGQGGGRISAAGSNQSVRAASNDTAESGILPPRIPGRGPRSVRRLCAVSRVSPSASVAASPHSFPVRRVSTGGNEPAAGQVQRYRPTRPPAAARAERRSFAGRSRAADGSRTSPARGLRIFVAHRRGSQVPSGGSQPRRHAKAPASTPADASRACNCTRPVNPPHPAGATTRDVVDRPHRGRQLRSTRAVSIHA
jgi:hypothetical protein